MHRRGWRPGPSLPRRGPLVAACIAFLLGACGAGAGGGTDDGGDPLVGAGTWNEDCPDSFAFYLDPVKDQLRGACIGCHSAGGLAGDTPFVLSLLDDEASLDEIEAYVLLHGRERLLSKSIGMPDHAGGPGYLDPGSAGYQDLSALLDLMDFCSPADGGGSGGTSLLADVVRLDNRTTLAKAALILVNRLPTEAEYAAVSDESGLRNTLRGYLQGPPFSRFIYETANDWFLTEGVILPNDFFLNQLDIAYGLGLLGSSADHKQQVLAAWKRQPLELVRFIVERDRPFTEVLTADYTMVDDLLASAYAVTPVPGITPLNNGWYPARVGRASGGPNVSTPFPHAGVLTTHAWLERFPTTPSNRNRHRISMIYRQFLGLNIEAQGVRTSGDSQPYLVPTMENPACLSCHGFMDPAAGAFMNWQGEEPIFRYNANDALDLTYKAGDYPTDAQGDRWYQDGDRWFRDVLAPGWNNEPLPGGYLGDPASVPFLAQRVAADSRFAKGAVRFWFRGLSGRRALDPPHDESDPNFATNLAAFTLQDDLFKALAADFRASGYNVRSLLLALLLSDWFRADSPGANLTPDQQAILADVGPERLLTPEQLQRRTYSVTDRFPFYSFTEYGGFDGGLNLVERNTAMTTVAANLFDVQLFRLLCEERLVEADFDLPRSGRRWFRLVERTDAPGDPAAEERIRANIQLLHHEILGEFLELDDPEIQRTFALFSEVLANDQPEPADVGVAIEGTRFQGGHLVETDPTDDPVGAIRAWNQVLLYLLTDFRFLHG
jgi:hypothetical protein